MPRYETAPKDLCAEVARVARAHHTELTAAGVTITTLLAFGNDGEPAIKHQGYAAAAVIKKTSHKDRVAGLDDAVLVIDGDQLGEWGQERITALIDHELTHLVVVEKDGRIKRDDCGRPKLKIRLHDAQVGVFFSIMERYGYDAIDTEIVARLVMDTQEWIQPTLDMELPDGDGAKEEGEL